MSNVSSTTAATSAADIFAALNGTKQKTAASQTSDTQDRFLTLLVTQLKNQDPLNPLDNAQVTTQLAQLNMASGIETLNATLSKLLDVYGSGQAMQAASMIGKNVLVPGNNIPLQSGAAVAGVGLATAADKVTVKITDAAGNLVATQDLGARQAGSFLFAWDGKTDSGGQAADGNYRFTVEAVQGGKAAAADALQIGTVNAVVRNTTGFTLDLGAQGTVDFQNVKEIL